MKIAVDTNVLVRAVVKDDPAQSQAADTLLRNASLIAVSLASLCEFVWVLRRVYGFDAAAVASAIRALSAAQTVEMNRPAVDAGLKMLEAGGDFADGIIAYEGIWLGGEVFVSFDKDAIRLLSAQALPARLVPS